MNAAQRRERILTRLNSAGAPLSASTLAAELGVSRQIVVGDVALLRAAADRAASGDLSAARALARSLAATPEGAKLADALRRSMGGSSRG